MMKKKLLAVLGVVFAVLGIIALKKKSKSVYKDQPSEKNPMEGMRVRFVENVDEPENADGVRGHLEAVGHSSHHESFYESVIKRGLDIILSFFGLVILSPVFLVLSLWIFIDDPGPILFIQKRVGKDKQYFKLHKFRSMKMSTPHDVPTHQLTNPEQYITKAGRFIRKHSLDELPQIWDIFIGNMSVIGPRPALWNQDLLTAERDKYNANDIKPGLTGWAQINGRDELEIPVKAALDGEYVKRLGLFMDIKCFLGSLHVFGKDDSVVEGGTGEIKKKENPTYSLKDEDTTPTRKKRILITGANSYIGDSVKEYLDKWPDFYEVEIIDTMGLDPQPEFFSDYDVVFNVAGIAHIKETAENRHLYYEVNRDLVVKIAKAAKEAGVEQFILLSTMSVYGKLTGYITKSTPINPQSAYGKSKAEADEEIKKLEDESFKFACLRPPMVYGKGCKGNYQSLRSFALKSPIFPSYKNARSMVYIGNLCEFVKRVIDQEKSALFFPQNAEYVNTSEMVSEIAKAHGKKMRLTKAFDGILKIASGDVAKKVFGSLTYEQVDTVEKYRFSESIRFTEG